MLQDHHRAAVRSYPVAPSPKQQPDIFIRVLGSVETFPSLSSFQDTVFMMSVNAQKPSFVIDRVHFGLDSQQGLSLGPVGPCSVHFTQLQLNPIRRIGFGRSGISLGFTIWNHISFSSSELLGAIATDKWLGTPSKFAYLIIQAFI